MSRTAQDRILPYVTVVAITCALILFTAGVRSAPGVFILPMDNDPGVAWDRATISFAVSLGLVMLGLGGPLTGWLLGRIGPRAVALSGLALVAASMAVSAIITETWQLDLFWGLLSGLGTGIAGGVLGAAVAARWFVARRGLINGVFGAAASAGQLIFYPLLLQLVNTWGWRTSALALGAGAVILIPLIWLLVRDDPADLGLPPFGGQKTFEPAVAEQGVMARAVRTPEFWLLAVTFFVCGATSNGIIGTHFIPHAIEHGFASNVAGSALALMGAMNFIGTLTSGWLTDRFDPRKLLSIYYGFRGLSLFFLPFVTDELGLTVFAVLFGLDYIATVPPTTTLVANNFGRKNVGLVYGWVFCSHQIGAAAAAWLGGIARANLGDYGTAFIAAGVVAVLGALLSFGIQRQAVAVPAAD